MTISDYINIISGGLLGFSFVGTIGVLVFILLFILGFKRVEKIIKRLSILFIVLWFLLAASNVVLIFTLKVQ